MSKVKAPREKKRLAYDRDHVTPAKYPHAFRRKWPKKKAAAERAARRKARQELANADSDLGTVRRKSVRKWGSITVRQSLEAKRYVRAACAGRKSARRAEAAGAMQGS